MVGCSHSFDDLPRPTRSLARREWLVWCGVFFGLGRGHQDTHVASHACADPDRPNGGHVIVMPLVVFLLRLFFACFVALALFPPGRAFVRLCAIKVAHHFPTCSTPSFRRRFTAPHRRPCRCSLVSPAAPGPSPSGKCASSRITKTPRRSTSSRPR